MDSYKHACPFCGQRVEYTDDYCGKQTACPSCGKTVNFPALPPGGKKALRVKRPGAVAAERGAFNFDALRTFFKEFEHWNLVGLCMVPFIIVLVLLLGAGALKKKFGSEPAPLAAPVLQADPNAWQKMTDLARAEQLVQDQVAAFNRARATAAAAQRSVVSLQAAAHGAPIDRAYYDTAAAAQKNVEANRQAFNAALQNYQKLGGQVDYQKQVSP